MNQQKPHNTPGSLVARAKRVLSDPAGALAAARVWRSWGESDENHVFLLGVPRAGTSLLATVLACNDELVTVGDETQFFLLRNYQKLSYPGLPESDWRAMIEASRSRAELFDKLAAHYIAQKDSASRFFEKTPGHALHMTKLAQAFPKAQFVFCVRDPRDAFASMKRAKNLPKPSLENYTSFYNELCNQYLSVDSSRTHLVAYEELVSEPSAIVPATCDFLGVPYSEHMLDPEVHAANAPVYGQREHHKRIGEPISPKSIGSWKKTLSEAEASYLVENTRGKLTELGVADVVFGAQQRG
ncbi:sulfotransferase family protein [Aurantiacibacter sp. MUD61]|uniref:sulfotransferase family protein n=1 Tax=Aurantiacibacter sp. MUD61 TaxID=3009083 RepID=UPI0022F08DC2|nr:sulfotransferase [Aurantiacibacter sp. MUD61]